MWQKSRGEGDSAQTTNYNQFNTGQLDVNARRVVIDGASPVQQHNGAVPVTSTATLGVEGSGSLAAGPTNPPTPVKPEPSARDSMLALSTQPGMGWVTQLANDPKYQGKIDWAKVDEVHNRWDYARQGLTQEGAVIVIVAVAFATAGVGSAAGGAVATGVGATGVTATVVSGAVAAGVLLCASKDSEVVEYSLSRSLSPALIADYQTQLPGKKILTAKLHEFYALNVSVSVSEG